MEATTDLARAFQALQNKKSRYDVLWQYYDGPHPLRYSTDRLNEIFKNINARFTQNWCAVVVDSVVERLTFKQFVVTGDEMATRALNDWWARSELALDADDVELCALVTGEAFVIAWPNDDGEVEAFYNDSRNCHVFYDEDNPRRMRLATKWWLDDEEHIRLTLYYPDRLEYFRSDKPAKSVNKHTSMQPLNFVEPADPERPNAAVNPTGQIPVFHFRRERRAIRSELSPSVLDTQDAVNKLFADMMVASEFGAFRQRYIISQVDVGVLKNAPNEIWDLPAGDGLGQGTQVGEFGETSLNNFAGAMDNLSASIAKQTRTPQSYFHLGARADPSGEALIAMEAPLNKKTATYASRLAAEWRRLALFVARLQEIGVGPAGPWAMYESPVTMQPFTNAQARATNVQAGVPLRTVLRREGWTPRELNELVEDAAAERAEQASSLGQALLDAQRGFDQGEG